MSDESGSKFADAMREGVKAWELAEERRRGLADVMRHLSEAALEATGGAVSVRTRMFTAEEAEAEFSAAGRRGPPPSRFNRHEIAEAAVQVGRSLDQRACPLFWLETTPEVYPAVVRHRAGAVECADEEEVRAAVAGALATVAVGRIINAMTKAARGA